VSSKTGKTLRINYIGHGKSGCNKKLIEKSVWKIIYLFINLFIYLFIQHFRNKMYLLVTNCDSYQWARAPPLAFDKKKFLARLYVVWFGLVLRQTLNLAPFLQLYSLWNDTGTGYNGACAKVNVVFTARRYALARSLLSTGVCLPRSRIVSRWLKISSNMFFGPVAPSF